MLQFLSILCVSCHVYRPVLDHVSRCVPYHEVCIRTAFRSAQGRLPRLYTNHAGGYSLEHVVPRSLLKQAILKGSVHGKKPWEVEMDPFNLHVASRKHNNLRSNYRFLLPSQSGYNYSGNGFTDVGGGNYVNHEERLFIPRPNDWGPIVRSVLHCHTVYNVDCSLVIVGGLSSVEHYCKFLYPTPKEIHHLQLCQSLLKL